MAVVKVVVVKAVEVRVEERVEVVMAVGTVVARVAVARVAVVRVVAKAVATVAVERAVVVRVVAKEAAWGAIQVAVKVAEMAVEKAVVRAMGQGCKSPHHRWTTCLCRTRQARLRCRSRLSLQHRLSRLAKRRAARAVWYY